MNDLRNKSLKKIISYTYPKLYVGKDWYIGFYAFDPVQGKMRRKKIKVNFIKKTHERRKYANELMKRLVVQLNDGWNPWINLGEGPGYKTVDDAFSHYRTFIEKMYKDNLYREDTYTSYISYIRNIENWNNSLRVPILYIYQFNRKFIQSFLEYIFIEKNNSAQTRDNYLIFLRTFSTFLVQNNYLTTKPTDGIGIFGKKYRKKARNIITESDMVRLKEYLDANNKSYLLACYILFYCFVRPKEMSMIQLKHISLEKQTLYIPDENSKNRKAGTVTIPAKVIHLMLELDIFSHAESDYLFSKGFTPGRNMKNEKMFRDYWSRYVRRELKFPSNYKFYSLKDTGITSMLRKYDSITVRDQARHADILMTDTYTPHDLQLANPLIKNHECDF